MHVATMDYALAPTSVPGEAARIWQEVVAGAARNQPGLIRLQLYSRPGALLAVGTWESKDHAEAFMRTGVFQVLKERLAPQLAGEPVPRLWTQETFLAP